MRASRASCAHQMRTAHHLMRAAHHDARRALAPRASYAHHAHHARIMMRGAHHDARMMRGLVTRASCAHHLPREHHGARRASWCAPRIMASILYQPNCGGKSSRPEFGPSWPRITRASWCASCAHHGARRASWCAHDARDARRASPQVHPRASCAHHDARRAS